MFIYFLSLKNLFLFSSKFISEINSSIYYFFNSCKYNLMANTEQFYDNLHAVNDVCQWIGYKILNFMISYKVTFIYMTSLHTKSRMLYNFVTDFSPRISYLLRNRSCNSSACHSTGWRCKRSHHIAHTLVFTTTRYITISPSL